jgi:hypothetical protein
MEPSFWKECVLKVVSKIADKPYQERTWFSDGGELSSPSDLFCELFDDYIFDEFLSSSDVGMNDVQRSLGIELKKIMNEYAPNDDNLEDVKKIFDDPKWEDIRETAKQFLNSF